MIAPLPLSRLLQLASPMLPVGAYAYSQGLEAAIESGIVHDAGSAEAWIGDVLSLSLCRFELPILLRMHRTCGAAPDEARSWNALFCAGRDSAEARAETLQMGWSLVRLLAALDGAGAVAETLAGIEAVSFPLAYAAAAAHWGIPTVAAGQAYAWSWLENQVAVAIKAIPIGQAAGQRILLRLGAILPEAVEKAAALDDHDLGNVMPGLALAACRHETQYSRLFRS